MLEIYIILIHGFLKQEDRRDLLYTIQLQENIIRMRGGNDSSSGYVELTMLNGGSASFAGITSSAGILITNGANISFSAGGNVATTGTASFSSVTASAGFKSSGESQLGTLKLDTDLAVSYGGTGKGTFAKKWCLVRKSN